MNSKKLFISPLFVGFIVLAMTLFLNGWTWTFYDELAWVDILSRSSLSDLIKNDFYTNGRLRPFSFWTVAFKFQLIGYDPQWLRLLRLTEFILACLLMYRYLNIKNKISILATLFAIGFWIKSPPQLEQLHWTTISENIGILFILIALNVRALNYAYSKYISYIFLIFAALTKEPFIIFIALPAILERNKKESIFSMLSSFIVLGFLFFNRHGYSAQSGDALNIHTLFEIVTKMLIDLSLGFPLLLLLFYKNNKLIKDQRIWKCLIFVIFGLFYGALVFSRAWTYTYYFAPMIFLISIGLAFLTEYLLHTNRSRSLLIYCSILSALLPMRLLWNWNKIYNHSSARKEIIDFIDDRFPKANETDSSASKIGSNCGIDLRSFGFAVDIRHFDPKFTRPEGSLCYEKDKGILDCCKNTELVAIGKECSFYSERLDELRRLGLKIIFQNDRWTLALCKDLRSN